MINKILAYSDGVYFTHYTVFLCEGKSYTTYNLSSEGEAILKDKKTKKTVCYAGTIFERYFSDYLYNDGGVRIRRRYAKYLKSHGHNVSVVDGKIVNYY